LHVVLWSVGPQAVLEPAAVESPVRRALSGRV